MKRSAQFPEVYRHGNIRIYPNPGREILIENTETGVTMRMDPHGRGGLEFTTNARVDPIRVSNMIGWRVSRD